jgi:alkylation response protein AidB-like acyl-CoA dehydrogenase
MDLNFTPEEQKFRAEVRAFIDANLAPETRERLLNGRRLTKEDYVRWHKTLYKKGWVAHT